MDKENSVPSIGGETHMNVMQDTLMSMPATKLRPSAHGALYQASASRKTLITDPSESSASTLYMSTSSRKSSILEREKAMGQIKPENDPFWNSRNAMTKSKLIHNAVTESIKTNAHSRLYDATSSSRNKLHPADGENIKKKSVKEMDNASNLLRPTVAFKQHKSDKPEPQCQPDSLVNKKLNEFGHTHANFNHNKYQGTVGFGLATSHAQPSAELESQRRRSVLDNLPAVPDRLLLQTQASHNNTYEKAQQHHQEVTRPLVGVDVPQPIVREINESVTFLKPTESFVHHVLMQPEEERTAELQVNSPFGTRHRPVNHKYHGTVGFGLSSTPNRGNSHTSSTGTGNAVPPPAVPDLQEGSHLLLQTSASRHNTYSAYKNRQLVEASKHRKAYKKPTPVKGRRASMSSNVYTARIRSSYRSKREIEEDSGKSKVDRRHSFAHHTAMRRGATRRVSVAPSIAESTASAAVEKESVLGTLQSLAGMASSPAVPPSTRPLAAKSTGKKLPGSARRVKTPAPQSGLRRSARNTPADTLGALDAQNSTPLMLDLEAEAEAEREQESSTSTTAVATVVEREEGVPQEEFLVDAPARRSARKAPPTPASDLSLLLQSSEKLIDMIDSTATHPGQSSSTSTMSTGKSVLGASVRRSTRSARNTPRSTTGRRSARKTGSARSRSSRGTSEGIDARGSDGVMGDILGEEDDDAVYKTEEEWEAEFAAEEAERERLEAQEREAEGVAAQPRLAAESAEVEKMRVLEEEAKAERLRKREEAREAEIARLEAEAKAAERVRLEQETERRRLEELEKAAAERALLEEQAREAEKQAQLEAEKQAERVEQEQRLSEAKRVEAERKAAEIVRLKEEARKASEDAERLRVENEAKAEGLRQREEARAVERARLEAEARETERVEQEKKEKEAEEERVRLELVEAERARAEAEEEAEVVALREAAMEAAAVAAVNGHGDENEEEGSLLEEALFAPQDVPVKRGRGRPRRATTSTPAPATLCLPSKGLAASTPGRAGTTPKNTPGAGVRKKKGVAFADSVSSAGKGKTATPLRRGTPHSKSKSSEGKASKGASPDALTPLTAVTTRSRRRESVRIDVDSLALEASVLLAESPLVPHLKRAQMDVSMISPTSAGPSPNYYNDAYSHTRSVLGSIEKSETNNKYRLSMGGATDLGRDPASKTPLGTRRRSICPDINDIISPGTPYVPITTHTSSTGKSGKSSSSSSSSSKKSSASTGKNSATKSGGKATPRRSARNKENGGDSLANILTDLHHAK